MHCALRLDLSSYTEDWFHVMVEKVDVAGAFQTLEDLATAEQRATVTHTNSIARELQVATAHVETMTREGEDLVHVSFSELILCSPTQGTGSPRQYRYARDLVQPSDLSDAVT